MPLRKIYSSIFLTLLVVFTLEIAFGAAGKWSEAFGFSFRKYIFLTLIAISVSGAMTKARIGYENLIYVLSITFFILIWVFFVPGGDGIPLHDSINDGQIFFGMIFIVAFASSLIKFDVYRKYRAWLYIILQCLAIVHIVLYAFGWLRPDEFLAVIEKARDVLEPFRMPGETSILISIEEGMIRIFWGGTILLLLYFYFAFRRLVLYREWLGLCIAVLAIITTATRSMLLAMIFFFAYFVFSNFLLKMRGLKMFFVFSFLLLMSLQTIPVIAMADPSFLKVLGLSRAVSDDLRFEQINALHQALLGNPWFGNGMGASAEIVRSPEAPWSYEMSIYALYMKIGVFGALVLGCCFYLLACIGRGMNAENKSEIALLGALILALNFCSNTNPFLFSIIGLFFIYIIYAEYAFLAENKD